MRKKKSYTIDPKEYEEDGLFHDAHSLGLGQDEDHPSPSEKSDYRPHRRKHESLKDEVKRLRSEAFFLRRSHQKLKAYKKKVEAYEEHYLVDLSTLEYICVHSPYGCKEAFVELQKDLENSTVSGERGEYADYSVMDTTSLRVAKSYLVYSPNPYCAMDLLLEDMKRCRLERLGHQREHRTTVGCLLLNDGEYVFFWPKVLHAQEDDCSVDPTTDTQSKGL